MQQNMMEFMLSSGHISGSNAAYVEDLYESYLTDPDSIPEQWKDYFTSLPPINGSTVPDVSHAAIRKDFKALSKRSRFTPILSNDAVVNSEHERKQVQVMLLISS
ncbi:MAG: 2-oxoglutarate dehydrogenase E1 component, partial [Pseudohongiellaceae bacterium]